MVLNRPRRYKTNWITFAVAEPRFTQNNWRNTIFKSLFVYISVCVLVGVAGLQLNAFWTPMASRLVADVRRSTRAGLVPLVPPDTKAIRWYREKSAGQVDWQQVFHFISYHIIFIYKIYNAPITWEVNGCITTSVHQQSNLSKTERHNRSQSAS